MSYNPTLCEALGELIARQSDPEDVKTISAAIDAIAGDDGDCVYAEALTATFQLQQLYSGSFRLIVVAPDGDTHAFVATGEHAYRVLKAANDALAKFQRPSQFTDSSIRPGHDAHEGRAVEPVAAREGGQPIQPHGQGTAQDEAVGFKDAVTFEALGPDGWTAWVRPAADYRMICCGCGLVHELDFAVVRDSVSKPDGSFDAWFSEDENLSVVFRARRAEPHDQGTAPVAEEGVALPLLATFPPEVDAEAQFNSRAWLQKAIEAKGATITGGGVGVGGCDLDFKLEGYKFNVRMQSR